MKAQVNEQCVVNANGQFWEQMLTMELDVMATAREFCAEPGHMFGVVALTGVWKGRVEIRMERELAYRATAAMMMQDVDTILESDVLDATKEIANMLAGTIKSSLPRPCFMTVPESAVQSETFGAHAPMEDALVVGFRHASGDLLVRIWEQENTAA